MRTVSKTVSVPRKRAASPLSGSAFRQWRTRDSNLRGGDGHKLFPSLLSDTVERATAPGLRGGNTPASIREGKRFRGRASRFMPLPSRQIQGFVKRRFALHVRHRGSERAPGVHTGAENRAAPFQSFLTGFMMVDGCAAGLSLGRADRTPQRSSRGSRGTCQASAPAIHAWRRDRGAGSEEDDG